MPIVELATSSAVKGQSIELRLQHKQGPEYGQLQVEVYDCGVLNPSSKLGFGTTPKRTAKEKLAVDIDTRHLAIGVYEVRFLRLHDGGEANEKPHLDLVVVKDYPRTFFEVVESPEDARPLDVIRDEVAQLEQHKRSNGVSLSRSIYGMTYPCLAHYIRHLSSSKMSSLERAFDWSD